MLETLLDLRDVQVNYTWKRPQEVFPIEKKNVNILCDNKYIY